MNSDLYKSIEAILNKNGASIVQTSGLEAMKDLIKEQVEEISALKADVEYWKACNNSKHGYLSGE